MSVWTLIQIVFDLFVFVGVAALAFRLRRPPQDDPRLSRGLQLLQTKITVLEDLSDRTDAQVKQLSSLLDTKTRVLQNKVIEAENQIVKIDHSMSKSMEVAEIFQDKIPHEEILERQRTIEYVKAARMAHSGLGVDEIAAAVALPREQVELIAKFNRDQLMFDESALPEWAQKEAIDDGRNGLGMNQLDFVGNLDTPPTNFESMAQVGKDFKSAIEQAKHADLAAQAPLIDPRFKEGLQQTMQSTMNTMQSTMQTVQATMNSTVQSTLQATQPAVMSFKATAQTLKEKLASTAEDMLRSQEIQTPLQGLKPKPLAPGSVVRTAESLKRADSPQVKTVIFPRIEK